MPALILLFMGILILLIESRRAGCCCHVKLVPIGIHQRVFPIDFFSDSWLSLPSTEQDNVSWFAATLVLKISILLLYL